MQLVKNFGQWYPDINNFVCTQLDQVLLEVGQNDGVYKIIVVIIEEVKKDALYHADECLSVVESVWLFEQLHLLDEPHQILLVFRIYKVLKYVSCRSQTGVFPDLSHLIETKLEKLRCIKLI